MENSNLLRLQQVINRTGLGRSSIYAMASKGEFPKPIKIGLRSSAWLENEVRDWIRERILESRGIAS
jgi:predicted DNA-binding transcriptional regulator AlpA